MMNETAKTIRKVTIAGVWINAILVGAKLFFGYWGKSEALVADGYHSISDFITDFIVIAFVAASYKAADSDHPYGHGKFETIATAVIGIILLCVGVFIGIDGFSTLIKSVNGELLPKPDIWTLYIATASIALKEFCYRYTIRYGRKLESPALIANAWHHRSDAISSVATLIGVSAAIFLGSGWRIMDPIASIAIALMISASAVKISIPPLNELLERSLPDDTISRMTSCIADVPGVLKVHNLRSRRNGHSYIIDVNIHVDPEITVMEGHEIATNAERRLKENFGDDAIIYVHIEPHKDSHHAHQPQHKSTIN